MNLRHLKCIRPIEPTLYVCAPQSWPMDTARPYITQTAGKYAAIICTAFKEFTLWLYSTVLSNAVLLLQVMVQTVQINNIQDPAVRLPKPCPKRFEIPEGRCHISQHIRANNWRLWRWLNFILFFNYYYFLCNSRSFEKTVWRNLF